MPPAELSTTLMLALTALTAAPYLQAALMARPGRHTRRTVPDWRSTRVHLDRRHPAHNLSPGR